MKHDWAATDARLTVFNKCSSVLSSTILGYVFVERHLTRPEWWRANATLPYTPESAKAVVAEFLMAQRIYLIHGLFFAVESSFRVYVRALDASACDNGLVVFQRIYSWLLNRLDLTAFLPMLDFWRNLRNTMHNNGLFLPRAGKNVHVRYQGKKYAFEVGKPCAFLNDAVTVMLASDVHPLLVAVVESAPLLSVAKLIPEPS